MAATFGQIQEFYPEIESIEAYIERVELHFEANNIDADRRVAVFLSVIGGKNYNSPPAQLVSREAKCQDTSRIDSRSQETFHPQKGGYRRTFPILSA